jgi:hypothetical protein
MKPDEPILKMEGREKKENDGGVNSTMIHSKYFLNVIMYPQNNTNMIFLKRLKKQM